MKRPTIRTYRRAFQIFVAVAFIVIPILNRSRYSYVYGNFLSFHMFGIPLADPLAVLQLTIKNFYLTLDNFIGTLLPLLLAFSLGTVFCSWICPYGLLSELTQRLGRRLLPRSYAGLPFDKRGFPIKFTIFLLGFAGFFIFSTTPILNQLSTAAWYARFFQYYFGQDFVSLCFLFILSLLVLEFFARRRLWCRYVCPQSVLITLTKLLNRKRLQVVFAADKCICRPGYERCEAACTLHLKPKSLAVGLENECSNCGDCVVACAKMGKALQFELMGRQKVFASLFSRFLPRPGWALAGLVLLAAVGGGYLALQRVQDQTVKEQATEEQKPHFKTSPVLSNHRIAWQGAGAAYYELLPDSTIICVGGQWPQEGFRGWYWEALDEQGSFRIIFDPDDQDTYDTVRLNGKIAVGTPLTIEHYEAGKLTDREESGQNVTIYEKLAASHQESAVSMDARVFLVRWAGDTYVLNLLVMDKKGLIERVLSSGDVITTEGMLTTAHKWINTPEIIVSEGKKPSLPIHTEMEIVFHDGHREKASFVTEQAADRSSEEFEDPWF